jgi:DNA-binding CsgD family transcriptional regulator
VKLAPHLRPQERRIVALLSKGLEAKEAAALMGLSTDTVKAYLHNAKDRLKIRTTNQLVAEQARGGIR